MVVHWGAQSLTNRKVPGCVASGHGSSGKCKSRETVLEGQAGSFVQEGEDGPVPSVVPQCTKSLFWA